MSIKKYKPYTPSRRHMTSLSFDAITETKPEKSLLKGHKKSAGRNSQGKITVRHRGGGAKRKLREIDFRRNKDGIPAKVASIQYDPNRTANIALLHYVDGEKRYILAPNKLEVGEMLLSGKGAEIKVGNALEMIDLPIGTTIHNVEMQPGKGGQIARSAGMSARLIAKEGKHATVQMPSGETRMLPITCKATIGQVGNIEHELVVIGKAGRTRHLGFRSKVRGSAMNPNDHPHGGGEGRTPIGMPSPVTPWGKPTLGYKTRRKKKKSTEYIIRGRKSKGKKK